MVRLMQRLDLHSSQFIAHQVLQALEAVQEFTHGATPEENANTEAFHSIQQRELMDRFTFSSYFDAKQHIEKYMYWYNNIRRHGALKGLTPEKKWTEGWACYPTITSAAASAHNEYRRPYSENFIKQGNPIYHSIPT